jgi:tetrapyrrole methylase family protein / MazG family protein
MNFKEERPLYKLMELASMLREKCPWDKEQTSISLKPYLLEEAYEAYEAIESGDNEHMKEELGDVLYQVYAHAEIADEEKKFTIDDIAEAIIEKLIRRHPHVFGNEEVNDRHDVIRNWEIIKKKEKSHRESILDGVPKTLPSLLKAFRIQQKVAHVGFDWEKSEDIIKKLDEEIGEFKQALDGKDSEAIKEEAGDILFSIVNTLRFIGINPEEALSASTHKFIMRFKYLEKEAAREDKAINEMTTEDLDKLWEKAKAALKVI